MINPKIILYPYDGQNDVPPAFYSETPDPLPDYEVSGFPVSIMFNDHFFKELRVIDFNLYKEGNKEALPVRLMDHKSDPNGLFTKYQFALFPLKRLAYDTDYRAEVVYMERGKKKHKKWSFHTKIPQEKMIRINKRVSSVTIEKGKNYLLYIVPLDGHDALKGITFPKGVFVRFVDNNTLRLKSDRRGSFDLKSKSHTIHVNVEQDSGSH